MDIPTDNERKIYKCNSCLAKCEVSTFGIGFPPPCLMTGIANPNWIRINKMEEGK